MQVKTLMSTNVNMVKPSDTLQEAAAVMAEHDIGFLPVNDGDRLVGTLTDRDIAVRAVALGKDASARVEEAMTAEVRYCYEDDDIAEVAANMGDIQVRRLPVVNRDKRLVGVLALGDLATEGSLLEEAADALSGISRAQVNGGGVPTGYW